MPEQTHPYLIYTDSAADLPASWIREHGIRIVPMDYLVDGKTVVFYTDAPNREEEARALYAAQRAGADVHTSQITPFRYQEIWTEKLKEGQDILYICFSSGMSSTYQNALIAAEKLMEAYPGRTVRVVDSKAATAGQGVLTCAAALNRDEKGMSLAENAKWLEENVPFLCHRFTVGDLDYLHRGGRVSAAVALIGGLLEIKPLMIINDEGKLDMVGKVSGKHTALRKLVKSYKNELGVENVPKLLFVSHSANDEEVPFLREKLEKVVEPGTELAFMVQSPIIGVHTGPWFFSVCGWGLHRTEQTK